MGNTFLTTQLADFFKPTTPGFQAIWLTPREQSSITKQNINVEPVRNLRQITRGTEIFFGGTIEFLGDAPSSSEIVDAITVLIERRNRDLVSLVINTGNSELGLVYVVLVEGDSPQASHAPSSSPSAWPESFLRNPNGVVGQGKRQFNEGPGAALIILAIASVAILTMLIFIFATRATRNNRGPSNDIGNSNINAEGRAEMVLANSAGKRPNISGDLNDDAEISIVSSVTDWNDYADHVIQHADTGGEVELNNRSVDNRSGMLLSAAAINCRGTMTLDKEENNYDIPKPWMSALHGDNSSITSQHKHAEDGALSDDDDSISHGHQGGFPQYNDGAFPTRDSCSVPRASSHIGTVAEDEQSDSQPSPRDIVQTFSHETSSLNQFISDLVWLEKKIAEENAKEATGVEPNEGSQGSGIDHADSYSYDCDAFSPRTLSDEESSLTTSHEGRASSCAASTSNSQAMSIICRDCYIPPGNLDIEITSTKDGPVIKSIGDRSLVGHLHVGDLIMALDNEDTRSLSAEAMATALSKRVSFQRKLTLLHFGGTRG